MKAETRKLILKIASAVMCALSIVPLFLDYIAFKNGSTRISYKFGETAGSGDALMVISRILFIATIVVLCLLLISVILKIFFKNDILNWVVIGASIFVLITVTLSFVSTLLYCLKISELGKIVWFPAIGCYILVLSAVGGSMLAMFSDYEKPAKTAKK